MDTQAKKLSDIAKGASEHAYTPYSNFNVGAAVELENGEVISGFNIENASYGLTMCAERNAIFKAVEKNSKIIALAVYGKGDTPPYPCGACRQVMAEFMSLDAPIYMACDTQIVEVKLKDLLPYPFLPERLT